MKGKKIFNKLTFFIISILVIILASMALIITQRNRSILNANQRQQQYKEITDADYETQSDKVKFMAYFLDGSKKVDGTNNRVGYNDTLYFDLQLAEGTLRNAKVSINSQNFYLETNLIKDSVISENYVSINTEEILMNELTGNISKTFEGYVKSGNYEFTTSKTEAIGNDISNYSKVNTIVFTADYVDSSGATTAISKEIPLTVEWYGNINFEIPDEVYGNDNTIQKYRIDDYIDAENNEMTIEFDIATQETANEVLIKKSYIEGIIPLINELAPTAVTVEGENVTYTYDQETRKFTASREATLADNVVEEAAYSGTYAQNEINYRYNEYKVKVTYPLDAYLTDDDEYINIDIPVTGYYEGFNGEKSNEGNGTINVTYSNIDNAVTGFDVSVGRKVIYPEERQVVSKNNILLGYRYNNTSNSNIQATYYTKWNIVTKQEETAEAVILTDNTEEDKLIKSTGEEILGNGYIVNKGIAFSNPIAALGEDGWIDVYDDETDTLLHRFTKDDWANYDTLNPYYYENDVKYIRIETSSVSENSFVIIYNIKAFNIDEIKQDFSKEDVEDLKYIETSFNGQMSINGELNTYQKSSRANFEEEISVVNFQVAEED